MSAGEIEEFRMPLCSLLIVPIVIVMFALAFVAWPDIAAAVGWLLQIGLVVVVVRVGGVVAIDDEGLVLARIWRLPWSRVVDARRVSVLGLPYLRVKRRKGLRWSVPLYYLGARSIEEALAARAPESSPLQAALRYRERSRSALRADDYFVEVPSSARQTRVGWAYKVTARTALVTLLWTGIALSFVALSVSAESYFRLRVLAEIVPSLMPPSEPALQQALEAANLPEAQQWIPRMMNSKIKQVEMSHTLAQSFVESWSKAMRLQCIFWLGVLAVLVVALIRVSRWREVQPRRQTESSGSGESSG